MMRGNGENRNGGDAPYIEVGCGAAKHSDAYTAGREAAGQAMIGIVLHRVSAVIVFASVAYETEAMLSGIRSVVGDAPLFGASSAGEICYQSMFGSVVVMVLASPFIKISLGVGRHVSEDWRQAVREAIDHGKIGPFFSPQDDGVYHALTQEGRSAFAILFSPGSTLKTDSHSPDILEELKHLSQGRIPFFGGAAYDDLNTGGQTNYVFCGNHAYRDGMVIAVFETSLRFGIAIGHGLHPTAKRTIATKVRECEVLELDGEPAADVFARLHGFPRESLEGKRLFEQLAHPFGVRHALGQYTIFVPRSFTPDNGVLLAHPVPEGTMLVVMESLEDEMIAAGKDTLLRAMVQSGISNPAAIFVCSCFLRRILLQDRIDGEISAVTDTMPGVPIVGFYSAGEQGVNDDHISRHNNEAIVVLLLGTELSYAAQVAEENQRLQRALERQLAEQQRLEGALAEQLRFLQTMMDTIPSPVFFKDLEGRYLGCNKAFEHYFTVRREDVVGRSIAELRRKQAISLHCEMDASLLKQGVNIVYEAAFRSRTGDTVHVIINKALFYKPAGSPAGIIGSITDITDRNRAEENRIQQLRLQGVLDMAGTICHEFNQPMQVLSGYTDLLMLEYASDVKIDGKLRTIKEQLSRMEEITRKLMAIKDYSVQDYAGIGHIVNIHEKN